MNRSILKTFVGGILLGTVVFFTGPLLLIILVLKFIFTLFGMGRRMAFGEFGPQGFGGPRTGGPMFAFADKIRNMSDEDYTSFKLKMDSNFQGKCGHKN
jgi:hypothetical protein